MLIERVRFYRIFDSHNNIIVECNIFLKGIDIPFAGNSFLPRVSTMSNKPVTVFDISNYERLFSKILVGKLPHTVEIDSLLEQEFLECSPDIILDKTILFAVSSAVCKAHAFAEDMTLYELIACLTGTYDIALPRPILPFFTSDGSANFTMTGSLVAKIVLNGTIVDVFAAAYMVYEYFGALLKKNSISYHINNNGYYHCLADDVTLLTLLSNAIANVNDSMSVDFALSADIIAGKKNRGMRRETCALDEIPDLQGLKGLLKNKTIELVSLDPGIQGIHGIKDIYNDVIIADNYIDHSTPDDIWQLTQMRNSDALVLGLESIALVSHIIQSVQLCREKKIKLIFNGHYFSAIDDYYIDFSIGLHAHFIHFTGFYRSEYTLQCNRFIKIYSDLDDFYK